MPDAGFDSRCEMPEAFQSLPILVTAGINAVISIVVVASLARPIRSRWIGLIALFAPVLIAAGLYWLPTAARHSATAAYAAWAPVVIGIWGLTGIAASLAYLFVLSWRRERVGARAPAIKS
jgi:hypothetical protein